MNLWPVEHFFPHFLAGSVLNLISEMDPSQIILKIINIKSWSWFWREFSWAKVGDHIQLLNALILVIKSENSNFLNSENLLPEAAADVPAGPLWDWGCCTCDCCCAGEAMTWPSCCWKSSVTTSLTRPQSPRLLPT